MHAINLYALSRISDPEIFPQFEKQLSQRETELLYKQREVESLTLFVDTLITHSAELNILNHYYYSFSIPQISKEFDLLRINDDKIINIELKSSSVPEDKIHKQLLQNLHYLSFLSCEVFVYSFMADSKTIYTVNTQNELIKVSSDILIKNLESQENCYTQDISSLFRVSNFLISPLNTPEKFLAKQYFLTSQQDSFKNEFLKITSSSNGFNFIGITGGAGTGKTLLLYDLALETAKNSRCCIIHCGSLSDGHSYLNTHLDKVDIIPIKDIDATFNFAQYQYLFVDESHRIFAGQFSLIVDKTRNLNLTTIFSFDSSQILSSKEKSRNIGALIENLPSVTLMKLSDKIRTNKAMASFIKKLMDQKSHDTYHNYPSISLVFASNENEVKNLLTQYKGEDYTFINYTSSMHYFSPYDNFRYLAYNDTHHVIGQEFDNVILIMDTSFYYDENQVLCAHTHPNPDYLYKQLLFQGLTRVREKLAIIVLDNPKLFQDILKIL